MLKHEAEHARNAGEAVVVEVVEETAAKTVAERARRRVVSPHRNVSNHAFNALSIAHHVRTGHADNIRVQRGGEWFVWWMGEEVVGDGKVDVGERESARKWQQKKEGGRSKTG